MNSFGRRYVEDPRDSNFPMSAVLPTTMPDRMTRYWNDTQWFGDQGPYPHCVAYAWMHWLEDGPVTHKHDKEPLYNPVNVYKAAQKIDEWEGENYAGTSVRAGAKVLRSLGIIESFRWAESVNDIILAILTTGPVVVGTTWYDNMSKPDQDYIMSPSGDRRGGHAYVLNGVNRKKKLFRMKNSWGRDWAKKGRAYISFFDMAQLLQDHGEACLAVEIKTGRP